LRWPKVMGGWVGFCKSCFMDCLQFFYFDCVIRFKYFPLLLLIEHIFWRHCYFVKKRNYFTKILNPRHEQSYLCADSSKEVPFWSGIFVQFYSLLYSQSCWKLHTNLHPNCFLNFVSKNTSITLCMIKGWKRFVRLAPDRVNTPDDGCPL
jgi:hypothetical protein